MKVKSGLAKEMMKIAVNTKNDDVMKEEESL